MLVRPDTGMPTCSLPERGRGFGYAEIVMPSRDVDSSATDAAPCTPSPLSEMCNSGFDAALVVIYRSAYAMAASVGLKRIIIVRGLSFWMSSGRGSRGDSM